MQPIIYVLWHTYADDVGDEDHNWQGGFSARPDADEGESNRG